MNPTGAGIPMKIKARVCPWLICLLICLLRTDGMCRQYRTEEAGVKLPRKRLRHVTAKLPDGSIAVFGGFSAKQERNVLLVNAEQTDVETLSVDARWRGRDISGISLPNGNVLIVDGGYEAIYDYRKKQTFPTLNALEPEYLRWATLTSLSSGLILVSGGSTTDFKPILQWALYDPEQNRFTTFGQMAKARTRHTATELKDGRILIAGGSGEMDLKANFNAAEILDLSTQQSTLLEAPMCHGRSAHAAERLNNGCVLLVGGGYGLPRTLSCEIFDPETMTFRETAALSRARSSPRLWKCGNDILVIGGHENARVIEVYDEKREQFFINPELLQYPRWSGFTLTPFSRKSAIVVGGRVNGSGTRWNNIEIISRQGRRRDSGLHPEASNARLSPLDAVVSIYDKGELLRQLPILDFSVGKKELWPHQKEHPVYLYLNKGVADCDEPRLEVAFSPSTPYFERVNLLYTIGLLDIRSIVVVSDLMEGQVEQWESKQTLEELLPNVVEEPTTANGTLYYTVSEYDPLRNPSQDLKDTIRIASKENKNILLQVGGDWCGWCGTLSKFMHDNKAVKKRLSTHYIIMKVNISSENKNADFLSSFPKISSLPHLFVLNSKGGFLHSQYTSPLEDGGSYNEKEMVSFLEKWTPAAQRDLKE